MVARKRENQENLNILEDIYEDNLSSNEAKPENFQNKIDDFFKNSDKAEKWLSFAILGFGLVAILLGFFQFRSNIRSYFIDSGETKIDLSLDGAKVTEEDLLGLRNKDTDFDGLSDYDELNIYNTSPYLPDTDSDNLSDLAEISRGSDPNCPEGKDCFLVGIDSLDDLDRINSFEEYSDLLLDSEESINQLRNALLQSGVNPEELSSLSDIELAQAYYQVLLEKKDALENPDSIVAPVKSLSELTPQQIRNLLIDYGVSEEILKTIPDDELLKLANQINN